MPRNRFCEVLILKKITALITALLLMSNLFVFPVSAANVTIKNVYPDGKTNYSAGDDVKITGDCTPGKDLVIRIYDEKESLIFTDVILAPDNNNGTFEFSGFKIPSSSSSGTLNYKVVVSEPQDSSENTNVATETMTVTVKEGTVTGGGGGGGGGSVTMKSWTKQTTEDNEEKKNEDSIENGKTEDANADDPSNDTPSKDPVNDKIIGESAKVKDVKAGVGLIDAATKGTPASAMQWESTRNTIAISVETMMANIGSKKINTSGSANKLVLKESSVTDSDIKKYTDTEKTLKDAVDKNKITLNRELLKEYIVNTAFSTSKKANITIYKGFVTKLEKAAIETLTINDKNFRVSYDLDELKNMIGDEEFTSFDIDTTAITSKTKKISINFDTDKTKTMKISFPGLSGDSKYMAIVDEKGNPVGGRYNPATDAVEARISESGVYQIVNNEKDFEDIKNKSKEMQESIKILAAKGIIEGTSAKEFSPDDTITRAEIAALLLRVLSQIDPNADGEFADVKKSDWFYGTAGSAKKYGMITGFEDNTFRGNAVIEKDQILTISSRVLKREMKYKTPDNIAEWLTFKDAGSIEEWAREDIAVATMANIITRNEDNTIRASESMKRGDAALIIMRLFYKIW